MDLDLEHAPSDGIDAFCERHATTSTWATWNLKKMGRLPPTPSATPDSTAMQHRQSTSIDSAVVLEDTASMYGVSFREKPSSPSTPRSTTRLSGFHFSPERPGSPISTPSSPDSGSEDSNEWDHICIGQKEEPQNASINEVQLGMERVSLKSAIVTPDSDLETVNGADCNSNDAAVESDNDTVSAEEADHILAFSLPTVRGINSSDVPKEVLEVCRSVTYAYAERIAALVDCFGDLSVAPGDAGATSVGSAGSLSQRQSSTQSDKPTGKGKGRPNQNKKRRLSDEENDEDDEEESGSIVEDTKEPGEERNVGGAKLRCIFRARNPTRFNVRDHTSCAMTMFTKFSDLRKHILNKHMADSEIVTCQRCKKGFPSRNALELHCEREPCHYKRADPEDGINSETAARIRFRGRDCGPSDEEQWKHLWQLAFPEDQHEDIEPFNFVPVLEHHELEPAFLQKLEYLKPVVQSFVPDDEQFEGLCSIIKALFESAVNDLTHIGLRMDYVNRQGSRTGNRTSRPMARVLWTNTHDRDSGIGLDSSEAGTPKGSGRHSSIIPDMTTGQGQQIRQISAMESRTPVLRLRSQLGGTAREQQTQSHAPIAPIQTADGPNVTDLSSSFRASFPASAPSTAPSLHQSTALQPPGYIYSHSTLTDVVPGNFSSLTDYQLIPSDLSSNMYGTMHINPAQLQVNYQQGQFDDVNGVRNNGMQTMAAMGATLSESGRWI
ncbi:hypothetical protein B0T21DRAFT_401993 [Apiosordaria backusii]|uniref:C2H2-type domain-containing protein n=1 Tax=Apiosordaria backusii TaxID=314023 RepID=A0AA40EE50_9PEZI|nr:hypothetical protein B0T21DRAFT_401993 [Apiosordaria backusii]